jgi:hypothetical protein
MKIFGKRKEILKTKFWTIKGFLKKYFLVERGNEKENFQGLIDEVQFWDLNIKFFFLLR